MSGACVQPRNLQDWQVRVRTGFRSLHLLVASIIIFCDGDISVMTNTVCTLSWFEERFFLKWRWDRTSITWMGLCLQFKQLDTTSLTAVYDSKLHIVKIFRDRFPPFATLDEEEALKGEK
jgi:hypothetical protein